MEKDKNKTKAPDYKPYPKEDDIYNQHREVPFNENNSEDSVDTRGDTWNKDQDTDPFSDTLSEDFPPETREAIKSPDDDEWNTENFDTNHTGDDLDVPGSELDDDEEDIGEEDEENNYYSLGGPRKE